MQGRIYMVATPIGNLQDITSHALDILKQVKLIFAEDTRVTGKLLRRFEINTPVNSYHSHSDHEKKLFILNKLLNGEDIALVTDAGTPGISDPGNELLNFLYENLDNIEVFPVVGASSVTAVLSISGFNTNKFLFLGFWPKSNTKDYFDIVKEGRFTTVYFDSPHRALKNLRKISEIVGLNRRVLVAFELTKMHERHFRAKIAEVINSLQEYKSMKGEVVVVIENASL